MKNSLTEIAGGLKSLFVGMRITIGQFFKPTVTVHYPHETLKIPARYRGHIELTWDPNTGKALCVACKLCEKACPSDCITVEGAKLEGAKKRSVTSYTLDFTKCSLCGSCVEACHDDAIRFSRDYNLAGFSKDEFVMDLLKKLQQKVAENPPVPAPSVEVQSPVTIVPSPAAVVPPAPSAVQGGGVVAPANGTKVVAAGVSPASAGGILPPGPASESSKAASVQASVPPGGTPATTTTVEVK